MNYMARIAMVAVTIGLAAATGCGRSDSKSAPPIRPTVSIAQPIPQKVHEWDEFTGRLASPETVEVRARVSGYIDKIHFKEGGDVKQGDLLVTIDQRPYQATVDRLKADLGAVSARAELARAEAKRGESLASTKAISI